jgi:hypothetical protein
MEILSQEGRLERMQVEIDLLDKSLDQLIDSLGRKKAQLTVKRMALKVATLELKRIRGN